MKFSIGQTIDKRRQASVREIQPRLVMIDRTYEDRELRTFCQQGGMRGAKTKSDGLLPHACLRGLHVQRVRRADAW